MLKEGYNIKGTIISIKRENPDDDDNSSVNSKGYNNFVQDYRQFFKNQYKSKKNISEKDYDISEMLGQANNLYLNNKFDEAINILHEMIRHSPDLQEPYHILSLIYEERGDFVNALYFLMLAAHLSQGESDIWIRCANLNRKIKNIQQAEYCITRALKIEKDNPYLLYERAQLQEELGNFKKAAYIYEKILKIVDMNSDILIHVSDIYEKLGMKEKSIEVLFNNYMRTNRKLVILIRLMDLYIKNEKFAEGVSLFEKLEESDGGFCINLDFKLRYLFCLLYNSPGKLHECLDQIIQEFIKLGNEIENHTNLIHLLYDLLKNDKIETFIYFFEKLEERLKTNIELAGINSQIYKSIGDYYFTSKQWKKSIDFYNRTLNIKKLNKEDNCVDIIINLSKAYSEIGDKNSALDILSYYNNIKTDDLCIDEFQNEEDNIHRDFLNNQVTVSDQESDGEDGREAFKDNFTKGEYNNLNVANRNNFSNNNNIEDVNNNNIFEDYTFKHKKFLGNKRIRLLSTKDSLDVYNFENYLKRRNSLKSIAESKNISSLRLEYDELFEEMNSHKNYYIKIQECLVYLETDKFDKFLDNTFIPLRQVLIQELKREEFRNLLFNNILEKSNIKNYFKIKNSIFDEDGENCDFEDDVEGYKERLNQENLFIRKTSTNCKKYLIFRCSKSEESKKD
jgi:tetratricopeptide (TPR) repeat protein